MDSLTPKTMVKTPNLQLYSEQWLIYCNFKAMAAILGRHFENNTFLITRRQSNWS